MSDQLKAGLSVTAVEENTEGQPAVTDLAERIKALRAENTVEAAPERISTRQVCWRGSR